MAMKKDKNMARCRICNKDAEIVVSFGRMPLANNFLREEDDFSKEYFFDLAALFCAHCKAFQLADHPAPEQMFHDEYAFFSGTSKKMAEHFKVMAEDLFKNFMQYKTDSFIVELGSNDGIMLEHFALKAIRHLGIEPSLNVAHIARMKGVETLVDFFNEKIALDILKKYGQADVISAANVMNHIPDLSDVARGIALLLKKDGVLVFEDPYAGDVIQKISYDQFYDEHIYMFSVESVRAIFEPHGFELFRVEPQTTHGGSLRYYLDFKGARPVEISVFEQERKEQSLGLDRLETYYTFGKACQKKRDDLLSLLQELKRQGKRVVGYAATAKSTTILNYSGIGTELIEYIGDTTPLKHGKFSPGMHIPIKPYEQLKEDNPDYRILFAWNHTQEIFEKEENFVEKGGKWIVFSPELKIISKE
jgi:methylation protein EvaC